MGVPDGNGAGIEMVGIVLNSSPENRLGLTPHQPGI